MRLVKDGKNSIQHRKVIIARQQDGAPRRVHRYRPSPSWSVGALAAAAAAGAVVVTGGLSAAFGAAEGSLGGGIRQAIASARTGMEAHAATSRPAVGASALPQAGLWQIQVGAFRNSRAIEEYLPALEKQVPELAGLPPALQVRSQVTRIRIGGIADETAAARLCARIIGVGGDCFAVAPGR